MNHIPSLEDIFLSMLVGVKENISKKMSPRKGHLTQGGSKRSNPLPFQDF